MFGLENQLRSKLFRIIPRNIALPIFGKKTNLTCGFTEKIDPTFRQIEDQYSTKCATELPTNRPSQCWKVLKNPTANPEGFQKICLSTSNFAKNWGLEIQKSSTCQVVTSKIMKSEFYYTNLKQKKSIKLLNLF